MKTILLIEDHDDIRNNTEEILELANYKVVSAKDGKEGLKLIIQTIPDLIICDIMMPELDGYGVLNAVQKHEQLANIPFIFLTAKSERSDFRKGMELGADDYITKPFSGTELLNAVESKFKKVKFFQHYIPPGLEALANLIQSNGNKGASNYIPGMNEINSYAKKQVIYSEGSKPYKLFYVIKGQVKVCKTNQDGKVLVTELLSQGDFLGYTALLEDTVYQDTAVALEETELALIPKQDFDNLINSNLQIAQKFLRMLSKNLVEKEKQLLSLAYNSLRKKVADALLSLQEKYKPVDATHYAIQISRDNLASIAGTATESLIRTLSDFSHEKLIEINEGSISILNEAKLKGLVN